MSKKAYLKQLWQWIQTIFTIRDIVSAIIWIVSFVISGGSYIAISSSLVRSIPIAVILFLVLVSIGQLTWSNIKMKRQQRIDLYKAVCERIQIENKVAREASTKSWQDYIPYFKDHPSFVKIKEEQGKQEAVIEMLIANRQSPIFDDMLSNSEEYGRVNDDIEKIRQNMNQPTYDKLVSLFMKLVKINNNFIAISLLVSKYREPTDSYRLIKKTIVENEERIEEVHRDIRMMANSYIQPLIEFR